jgi:hypothetical protein
VVVVVRGIVVVVEVVVDVVVVVRGIVVVVDVVVVAAPATPSNLSDLQQSGIITSGSCRPPDRVILNQTWFGRSVLAPGSLVNVLMSSIR